MRCGVAMKGLYDVSSWIKQNPIFAGAVAVFIAFLAYDQLSGPKNFEDCVLQVVKDAKTKAAANSGRRAGAAKFPKPKINDPFQ